MVQLNGLTRGDVLPRTAGNAESAEQAARALPAIQRLLQGRKVQRVVYVPDRIVNFVLAEL